MGHLPEVGVEPAVEERVDGRGAESERFEQQVDEREVRSTDRVVEELSQQRMNVPRGPADDEHDHDTSQDTCRYVSTACSVVTTDRWKTNSSVPTYCAAVRQC